MIDRTDLERRLRAAFPDGQIVIEDLTGGADHYKVEIVSTAFAGKTPLQRHRLVYAPLKDVMGGALHALALTTKAPGE